MQLNATQVYNKCSKAVLKIISYDKDGLETTGSAIIIKSKGVVVTNYHILRKSSSFELYEGNNLIEYKRILVSSKKDDLLIFQLKDSKNFPDIGVSIITNIGDPVFAIGNPLQYKDSITEGIINGKERIVQSYDHPMKIKTENLLQISAQISPGNSGGGLFNVEGELIGITTSTDSLGQNINFAIPIEDVLKLIRRAPKKVKYENENLEKEVVKYQLNVFNGNYKQALLHINNCLKLSKNELNFMYIKAQLLIDLNKIKSAINICKSILNNYNDDYSAFIYLISTLIRAEQIKEALRLSLIFYKKHPKDYDLCVNVGTRYIELSDYNKASLYLVKASKLNRKRSEHLIRLARMYIKQQKFSEANEILQKVIRKFPREHYALYLLSELNYSNQNFEESFKYINEYLDKEKPLRPEDFEIDLVNEFLYPTLYDNYMGVVVRIDIIASMKEYEEALFDVNYLLHYYPNESYLYVCRSRIMLMMNETEKALEDVSKALIINPNNLFAYSYRAKIYLQNNKYGKALSAIQKPLNVVPNSILYLNIKATALFGMKRYTDVLKVCRKVLKFNDRHFEALDLMRKCYLERGNLKMALVYANKQLAIKPCDSMNLYNVSNILFKSGNPKEALPYLNKALKWNPHIDVHILRGKINSLLGDNRSAIEDFKKADKIEKDNVDVYHYRGMAYFKTQKYSLALIDLENATHLDPSLETELGPIITEARKLNGLIKS